MLEKEILGVLVKLAAAGTSGVCILGVFWCGYVLFRLPSDVSKVKHDLLKRFMNMTLGIAVISAVSSIGAGYWDLKGKEILRKEIQTKGREIAQKDSQLKSASAALAKLGTSVRQNDVLLAELQDHFKAVKGPSRSPASGTPLDGILGELVSNSQAMASTLRQQPDRTDIKDQKPIIK